MGCWGVGVLGLGVGVGVLGSGSGSGSGSESESELELNQFSSGVCVGIIWINILTLSPQRVVISMTVLYG